MVTLLPDKAKTLCFQHAAQRLIGDGVRDIQNGRRIRLLRVCLAVPHPPCELTPASLNRDTIVLCPAVVEPKSGESSCRALGCFLLYVPPALSHFPLAAGGVRSCPLPPRLCLLPKEPSSLSNHMGRSRILLYAQAPLKPLPR